MSAEIKNAIFTNYLPQILSFGIGPIVPLFIQAFFKDFSPPAKWTLATTFIAITWITSILERHVGIFFHFSDWLTISCLLIFIFCNYTIYIKLQNIHIAKVTTYIFALATLSIAAANANYLDGKILCIFNTDSKYIYTYLSNGQKIRHNLARSIQGKCLLLESEFFKDNLVNFTTDDHSNHIIDKDRFISITQTSNGAIYEYDDKKK